MSRINQEYPTSPMTAESEYLEYPEYPEYPGYPEYQKELIPHQVKRPDDSCRLKLKGMNPHPSNTFPLINCQQYFPDYCQPNIQREVYSSPDPENVIVNLGPDGNIEVAHLHGEDLFKKQYKWNRLPPLSAPYSKNIPEYIKYHAWNN